MNEIKCLLKLLPHHLQVTFAVYCCNDIKHLMNKQSIICLELVEKWLAAPHLVSKEELNNAAHAAYAASYAASSAAYAANAAANATNAATYAASSAAYAASYAANAAYATKREEKLKQYETYLVQMIDNLTDLEKTIYNLGGLQ